MTRRTHWALLGTVLLIGACEVESSGEPRTWETGNYDPALVRQVQAQTQQLRAASTTQPSHPYAGAYYQGDGLGANMRLELGPSGEYTFTWHGCLGLYHMNHGTVSFDGTAVDLHPQLKRLKGDSLRVDLHLLVVRWGERRYLIAPENMKWFIDCVNRSSEPRTGLHGIGYLRVGDEKIAVSSDPGLPAEYRDQLAPLVIAKIVRVGNERVPNSLYPNYVSRELELDVGATDGAQKGDIFTMYCDGVLRRCHVTQVFETTGIAEIYGERGTLTLAVGDELNGRIRK